MPGKQINGVTVYGEWTGDSYAMDAVIRDSTACHEIVKRKARRKLNSLTEPSTTNKKAGFSPTAPIPLCTDTMYVFMRPIKINEH